MGWRGAIRSIAAAQRRNERELIRRQKELHRRQVAAERVDGLQRAAGEVDDFNHLKQQLTSMHDECGDSIDWQNFADARVPDDPIPAHAREVAAQEKLNGYRPGWVDKLLRRSERKLLALEDSVRNAKEEDAASNLEAQTAHANAVVEWRERKELAARVLKLDPDALRDAVHELDPLSEIKSLGSTIELTFRPSGIVEATLHVGDESVVPRESKSLLKSGKLSVKKMPVGEFWDLYQHYVASAVFRVARELHATVPVRVVFVTAVADLLNTSTGYVELQPILSAKLPCETLDRLNFATIDSVDALRNFVHEISFQRTKGMLPIRRLVAEI